MKVSVAIVTYNRAHAVKRCLDSLTNQTVRPDEIIVIDSSENDETEGIIKNKAGIIYRHLRQRTYQPKARNIALKLSKGDVIAYLDDDAVCTPDWLENIKLGYSYRENIVGVGGPVISCDSNLSPLVKIKGTDRNQNYFTACGDIHMVPHWSPSKPVKTKLFIGANMSFRKENLKGTGGFDEYYGRKAAYREETDPQIAMVKKGYTFIYMPGAVVYHLRYKDGGIRQDQTGDYFYWYAKNHKYLADKYFPKWLSRMSWLFWSFDPPCLWLCLLSTLYRRDPAMLEWIKGLWSA